MFHYCELPPPYPRIRPFIALKKWRNSKTEGNSVKILPTDFLPRIRFVFHFQSFFF